MSIRSMTFDDRGDVLIVHLVGQIDGRFATLAADEICSQMANTALGLVVDLAAVTYIDSAGIAGLLAVEARLRSRDQRVRAAVPDASPIRPTLAFAGLAQAIPLCQDVTHAILSIHAQA